jgi:hypothetical protein
LLIDLTCRDEDDQLVNANAGRKILTGWHAERTSQQSTPLRCSRTVRAGGTGARAGVRRIGPRGECLLSVLVEIGGRDRRESGERDRIDIRRKRGRLLALSEAEARVNADCDDCHGREDQKRLVHVTSGILRQI